MYTLIVVRLNIPKHIVGGCMRPATLGPATVKKLQAGLGGQIGEQVAEGCSAVHVQVEGWRAATQCSHHE